MSLARAAASAQLVSGYYADSWFEVKLPAMTKLWQGIGGHSDFFLSEEDAREARGAYVGSEPFRFARKLWRLAQARPSRSQGFRLGVREFVVDLDAPAAVSVCFANSVIDGENLGPGGVIQYYIPDWARFLHTTGREFDFAT